MVRPNGSVIGRDVGGLSADPFIQYALQNATAAGATRPWHSVAYSQSMHDAIRLQSACDGAVQAISGWAQPAQRLVLNRGRATLPQAPPPCPLPFWASLASGPSCGR